MEKEQKLRISVKFKGEYEDALNLETELQKTIRDKQPKATVHTDKKEYKMEKKEETTI